MDWFSGEGGLRLAADLFGPDAGVPVLLLPGGGQTRHSWRRTGQRLGEAGFRAVALDLRGHGDSDRAPEGDYGYAWLVADIRAVADALGRPPVLVGASLGGKVALAAAGHAGIGRALVLVDTAPHVNADGVARVRGILQAPPEGFASLEEAAGVVAANRGQTAPPGAGERLRRTMRQDADGRWHWHWDPLFFSRDHRLGTAAALDYLEGAARKLTVPALLIHGERSDVVDAHAITALRAVLPAVEVCAIPGAGHMVVGDHNDAFADALLDFLRRVAR
ncbi:MAG: alpha/beta hydrolase [Azospirillaceae bacterium]|nr:alpha/beta hydrolase [Azospirillaceae bacterium]